MSGEAEDRSYEVFSTTNGTSSATSGCGHSPDSSENLGFDNSEVLSGVDSDWDEEDIQLLRLVYRFSLIDSNHADFSFSNNSS